MNRVRADAPTDAPTLALVPPLHRADAPVQFWPDAAPAGPLWLVLPASDCPLIWDTPDAATPRQAAAAARARALATAIDADVHVVAEPAEGPIPVATTGHPVMRHWLSWAAANGHAVTAVVPAALALPEPPAGAATAVTLAGERMVRQGNRVFALEPALADALADARAGEAAPSEIDEDAALGALAHGPRCNLLAGPYAPPRARLFTPERLRAVAAMIALILLLSLAMGVARLVRLHADIARIDGETVSLASTALGRAIAADTAVAELDARLATTGISQGSAGATLAALMQAMEPQPAVSLDAAAWDRAGTLTVTMGATRTEELNPVLTAIQTAGYRITAQPRQGSDGRALVDMTIRSEP